jgi:CubicO group peptidase (beta-lactamase class C family)
VSAVTGDTVFRIAIISKTFTTYVLLLDEELDLDTAITKFIPKSLDREELPENGPVGPDFFETFGLSVEWHST